MNRILALREKRAKEWDAAKNWLDTKADADGRLSDADAAVYDQMEKNVAKLGEDIERLERQQAIDDALARATSRPLKGDPSAPVEKKKGRMSDEYAKAFWDSIRTKAVTPRIVDALETGTDSEGGYLVPDEFERTLVQALEEENVFRQLAKTITTSSGEIQIPVVSTHGQAYWTAEEGAYTDSDEAFGQVTIGAHKLTTMIKISEELLYDSAFDLEAYMASEFARRLGTKEEEAFFNGDGVGKPLGIFAASGGAQLGVTAASQTAITADEILDLTYSLKAPYRKNAVYVMNDASIKAIRKLKDSNGQYMWAPGLTAGQPDTILGRPVKTSAYVPTMAASAKAIAFGDFRYYWIADRQRRSVKKLVELYAANGQVGIMAMQRVDGKLTLPEAIKCLQMKA